MSKLEEAFKEFDTYNQQDPHIMIYDGQAYASEYFYALQLHHWIKTLNPGASEALLLASRSQHIGRWESPRENYPDGKAGYLNWRKDLSHFHAKKSAEILESIGYDDETIKSVQAIIRKENIKQNADVQTMENALCLVFLQFQFEDFIKKYEDDKLVRILQKSWAKMNDAGRKAALSLSFHGRAKMLLEEALQ